MVRIITVLLYLLRPPSGVHRYGVGELWRNTANGGAHWAFWRGNVIGTVLVLAVTGGTTTGKSRGLVQRQRLALDT